MPNNFVEDLNNEKMFKKTQLYMAKISHELRSPLNGIIGFAELMYHGKVGPISPEHKSYLADILTSARHLLLLVNDIIDIAKFESGNIDFNADKINFEKVLHETQEIFKKLIRNKNINFSIEIDPQLPEVMIDIHRFKQIIYNYTSNALKCTHSGGQVILRVLRDRPNFFRFEVQDTGIGIRKEYLERLFIEFQQLDLNIAKQYPSSGLGLALTKHLVEAQGGEVGVESTFGKGSRFFAILPCTSIEKKP